MRNLLLFILCFISFPSVFASTVRINLADTGQITDRNIDGTADSLYQSIRVNSTNIHLGSTGGVVTKDDIPLGSVMVALVKVPFVEFDISSLDAPIVSASLNFTRFSGGAFERLGQIQVSGYAADGTVTLADFNLTSQSLGLSGDFPATGTSQFISLDISDFLIAQTGDFVGFRFDMTKRGGARLWDNGYFIYNDQEAADWAKTPVPYLSIETAVVPVPAAAWLFISAMGGLAVLKRKNA